MWNSLIFVLASIVVVSSPFVWRLFVDCLPSYVLSFQLFIVWLATHSRTLRFYVFVLVELHKYILVFLVYVKSVYTSQHGPICQQLFCHTSKVPLPIHSLCCMPSLLSPKGSVFVLPTSPHLKIMVFTAA